MCTLREIKDPNSLFLPPLSTMVINYTFVNMQCLLIIFQFNFSVVAGHLLEYHRTTEEQNHRNVRRRIKETHEECGNSRGAETPHGNTFDGILLVRL